LVLVVTELLGDSVDNVSAESIVPVLDELDKVVTGVAGNVVKLDLVSSVDTKGKNDRVFLELWASLLNFVGGSLVVGNTISKYEYDGWDALTTSGDDIGGGEVHGLTGLGTLSDEWKSGNVIEDGVSVRSVAEFDGWLGSVLNAGDVGSLLADIESLSKLSEKLNSLFEPDVSDGSRAVYDEGDVEFLGETFLSGRVGGYSWWSVSAALAILVPAASHRLVTVMLSKSLASTLAALGKVEHPPWGNAAATIVAKSVLELTVVALAALVPDGTNGAQLVSRRNSLASSSIDVVVTRAKAVASAIAVIGVVPVFEVAVDLASVSLASVNEDLHAAASAVVAWWVHALGLLLRWVATGAFVAASVHAAQLCHFGMGDGRGRERNDELHGVYC